MQSSDDVSELVVYCQLEAVAEFQFDCGKRPFAVDAHHSSLELAVRIGGCVSDIPFQRLSCCECGQREEEETQGRQHSSVK